MKIIILITILLTSISEAKNEKITFNNIGEFIPPDIVLLEKGLKAYDQGSMKTSLNYFLKSVEFGNEKAKHMIAVIKIANKNVVEAHAWLSLIKKPNGNINLLGRVKGGLTEEELKSSVTHLQGLKEKYNEETSFKRRNKWERGLKGSVGTRMRGIDSVSFRSVQSRINKNIEVSAIEVKNKVIKYVKEYEPEGIVTQGEIKSIEKTDS